jgi:hypothetical protein
MNRGLLAAARNIRRKQSRREAVQTEDRATMWGVALIESVSLGYMLYSFEQPHDAIQWLLLFARASVIPYATIYLETQRQQPIDPQDISIQTEIGSGLAVLREIVTLANAPDVPMTFKVGMYKASADLTPLQLSKLDGMQQAADLLQTYRSEQVTLVDAKGQPLLSAPVSLPPRSDSTNTTSTPVQTHRKRPHRGSHGSDIDARQTAVFKHLDAFPATTARELAKRFGVAPATAQMDIRAWKAARQAVQQETSRSHIEETSNLLVDNSS